MKDAATPLFPMAVRRALLVVAASLLALALLAIAWRGPAILLDLSALGAMLGCF